MDIVERFINYTKINTTTSREKRKRRKRDHAFISWSDETCEIVGE